jgi:hypothetical protein
VVLTRVARAFALSLAGTVAVWSAPAWAARRPHFEPTDLDLEDTGIVELDLQLGPVRGPDAWRAVIPDFELDLGLLPNLELGLDGAYAVEGAAGRPFSFDHAAPDSLWPAVKWGVLDTRQDPAPGEPVAMPIWALGLAAGPKLPVTAASRGVGAEALVLVGCTTRRLHAALNLGGFVEPHPDASTPRPGGLEGGLDLAWDITDRVQLLGEVSGAAFWSPDPAQAAATAGASWDVADALTVSLVGLVGFLPGADHLGLLVGVAPKLRLFGR